MANPGVLPQTYVEFIPEFSTHIFTSMIEKFLMVGCILLQVGETRLRGASSSQMLNTLRPYFKGKQI
jgi:hypothetical protein